MNPKTKRKKQKWPYVTWANREEKWLVDTRTKDGGTRKMFEDRDCADAYARECRQQREREGTMIFGNAELKKRGWTVQQAIEFALKHLRQSQNSAGIKAAIDEMIQLRAATGRSRRYQNDLRARLHKFANAFPARTVASFTARDLDTWLASLAVAPGTRNTFRRDLRTLFSFCEKRGYCTANEAKKTEKAREVDKPAAILTVAQTAALLAACEDDTLPVVAISIFAGLRAAEVQKLHWSEIDFESGHIEVTAAKSKTARRRLVPISPNLALWIRPLARLAGPVAPAGLRKRFDAVKARAGFETWPQNAMRHSYGSYRLGDCHDAARVALEMGNSAAMVFAHYRELVRPKEVAAYWQISPVSGERVVSFKPQESETAA